jgi:hypothetical protein
MRTRDGSREIRIDGLGKRTYIYKPIGVKSNIIQLLYSGPDGTAINM